MKFDGKTNIKTIFVFQNTPYYSRNSGPVLLFKTTERFHSRDQHLCKFMRTKESYVRKEFNSHRIYLEHQHVSVSLFWDINMAAVTSYVLNIPKSKGPSQQPINLTKVFGISSNTPNSDKVSKKRHDEAIKEVIKIRYTITISFTHSKDQYIRFKALSIKSSKCLSQLVGLS